jgi:hypothetical protein
MTTEKFMESRTELELKVLQFLRETGEPLDIEFYMDNPDFHVLDEFAEGYGNKRDGFSVYNIDGDIELESKINEFLRISQKDRETGEHKSDEFILVIDLIGELGL